MAASNRMSMHLTEDEVLLVRRFLDIQGDFFHLGALGRLDEHTAFEVLAKLIRRIRGRSLQQIIDSHQVEGVIYDIQKLRVCHAATGEWLDALENRMLHVTDADSANFAYMNSQVASLSREFDEVRRKKNKVDATFEEIRGNLDEAILAQTALANRRATLNSVVFLPGDDLPPPV